MGVDTAAERKSASGTFHKMLIRGVFPDATISNTDRVALRGLYSGITVGEEAAPTFDAAGRRLIRAIVSFKRGVM